MIWKDQLKEMKLNHLKTKAPGFYEMSGGPRLKVKSYSDSTSNGLTTAIIDWVKFSGGDANRINSQGQVRITGGRASWTHGGTRKGTADIHGIYQGRHLSIEVKVGKDRVSDHQNKERERIEAAGGLYFVAKDMNSFIQWFNGIHNKIPNN